MLDVSKFSGVGSLVNHLADNGWSNLASHVSKAYDVLSKKHGISSAKVILFDTLKKATETHSCEPGTCNVCQGELMGVIQKLLSRPEHKISKGEPMANKKANTLFAWNFTPSTQKAKGISWLGVNSNKFKTNEHVFFPAKFVHNIEKNYTFPVFVRPCPVKPRHGFVDSRLATNVNELEAIAAETRAAEADAEVGICRPLTAEISAVLANGILTIGPGNDGATSGSEHCLDFPLIDTKIVNVIPKDIVGKDEAPFYEFVYDNVNDSPWLVQLRSGPKVALSRDFIPADTVVETVLEGDDREDLLKWEKMVEEAGPGVVIHTASMSCHYAIHGVINNVPVVTSFKPNVGDTLVKNTNATPKIDTEEFTAGFTAAFNILGRENVGIYNASDYLQGWFRFVLGALHNATAIIKAGRGWLLGYAAGIFVNMVYIISSAETRYWQGGEKKWEGGRMDIYHKAIQTSSAEELAANLFNNYEIFMSPGWSGGFGGPKWADVVKGGIDVVNAMGVSPENCVAALNVAVNKEHNNGWFLNKIFSNKSVMNDASNDAGLFVIQNAKIIYKTARAAGPSVNGYSLPTVDVSSIEASLAAKKKVYEKKIKKTQAATYTVTGNKDPEFWLQVRRDNTSIRLQIYYHGGHFEWNVPDDTLTKQGIQLVEDLKGEVVTSLYGTNVKYSKCELKGKASKWFYIDNKRVISFAKVAETFNKQTGKVLEFKELTAEEKKQLAEAKEGKAVSADLPEKVDEPTEAPETETVPDDIQF